MKKTSSPAFTVLVLNASYEVLSITRWQRALCMIFSGKAEVVEESECVVRSPSVQVRVPSVIRIVYYIKMPRLNIPFSRTNVFLRDRYVCQYCGGQHPAASLTLDHVIPRSEGGITCWENVVTACRGCNVKKGDHTPEDAGMKLLRKPRAPHYFPTLNMHLREEWERYLPFPVQTPHGAHQGAGDRMPSPGR
ncbi:MAG: HNH endonuclease [bacterium]